MSSCKKRWLLSLICAFSCVINQALADPFPDSAPLESGAGQPVTATIAPATQEHAALLFHANPLSGGGLQVKCIDPGSPTSSMIREDDPNTTGALEAGDVVTAVDGNRITSLSEYYRLMRNAGEEVVIRVEDVRTGAAIDWRVKTVRVQVPPIDTAAKNLNDGDVRIHVVYAALTEAERLGVFIQQDLRPMENMITGLIDKDRLASFTKVYGDNCSADGIRAAVDALDVRANDSVFFYYEGHGAYDENLASGDPAYGHHFQLAGGGLLRKELLGRLLAKNPRFTLLATDCCNVKAALEEPGKGVYELRTVIVTGWTGLEELLVCHRGVVDFTATSRGEFAWFDSAVGGWFSNVFREKLYQITSQDQRNWNQFMSELTDQVDHAFQVRKLGKTDPDLLAQEHMRPLEFTFNVTREEPANKPTKTRRIAIPASRVLAPR